MRRKIRFDRSNGLKVDLERKIDSLINIYFRALWVGAPKICFSPCQLLPFLAMMMLGYGLVDLGLMLFNALIFRG